MGRMQFFRYMQVSIEKQANKNNDLVDVCSHNDTHFEYDSNQFIVKQQQNVIIKWNNATIK